MRYFENANVEISVSLINGAVLEWSYLKGLVAVSPICLLHQLVAAACGSHCTCAISYEEAHDADIAGGALALVSVEYYGSVPDSRIECIADILAEQKSSSDNDILYGAACYLPERLSPERYDLHIVSESVSRTDGNSCFLVGETEYEMRKVGTSVYCCHADSEAKYPSCLLLLA